VILMKKIFFAVVIYAVFGLNQVWAENSEPNETANKTTKSAVPEEWVVVLDDPRPKRLQGWQRTGYRGGNNYRSAVELKRFGGRLAKDYNLALKDQWLIESLGGVQWIQPSNEFRLLSSAGGVAEPLNSKLMGESLDSSITGEGVTIAIIDSAVDRTHSDLAPAVELSQDFVVAGASADSSNQLLNGEAHGTAIAGVMIAQRDSKAGIAGVAPKAKLLAYRGCWENSDGNTNCNTLSLARALDAVARSGADILNLSLSGPKDLLLDQLLDRVIANGAVVVAAFDPQRVGQTRFPSKKDGVLIVRAEKLDSQFQDIFTAPGARVVASPGNNYGFMKGHSIATAYTSGVLALHKQFRDSIVGQRGASQPIDWRELSKNNKATDLMQQLIDESPQTSRNLLTNRYAVVSN